MAINTSRLWEGGLMRTVVGILALASLLFVFICSMLFPESPYMWLATSSPNFTLLRIILITLIATLLITAPVFDHHLHGLLGIFAGSMIIWALLSTYDNHLQILDSLSFLAAGISLGIEALEPGRGGMQHEHVATKQLRVEMLAAYAMTRFWALSHPFHHRAQHTGHGRLRYSA